MVPVELDIQYHLLLITALILLVTLAIGLAQAVLGRKLEDRMLSIQLLGTGGVAMLLLLTLTIDRVS